MSPCKTSHLREHLYRLCGRLNFVAQGSCFGFLPQGLIVRDVGPCEGALFALLHGNWSVLETSYVWNKAIASIEASLSTKMLGNGTKAKVSWSS